MLTGTPGDRPLDSPKFVYNERGDLVFDFGKHEGKRADLYIDYVRWMVTSDFDEATLLVCQELLDTYGG